jgi:hypothetical protein
MKDFVMDIIITSALKQSCLIHATKGFVHVLLVIVLIPGNNKPVMLQQHVMQYRAHLNHVVDIFSKVSKRRNTQAPEMLM